MHTLNYLLLAVKNPLQSAELYTKILGREPVHSTETFVLYAQDNGMKIGLWGASDIEPASKPAGGIEISFTEESRDAVLNAYEEWTGLGLTVVQEPADTAFGFTFVVEDPDGHRLRPFVPANNPR